MPSWLKITRTKRSNQIEKRRHLSPLDQKLSSTHNSRCQFTQKKSLSPEGTLPQARKIQNFRDKLRFPKSKKSLQRSLGLVNYYRKNFPRMAEKLIPFYKLLKTEVPITITSELEGTIDSVIKTLSDACQLALKQPFPGKQLVLGWQKKRN